MEKSIFKTIVVSLAASLFLVSCAAKGPMQPIPEFTPPTFDSSYKSSVDNFLVIMDASSSMNEFYNGNEKNIIASEVAGRMNLALPELGQTAGLRYFGYLKNNPSKMSDMLYGMEDYNSQAMADGLDKIGIPTEGFSPLNRALDAARTDLDGLSGKTAVVIISDAKNLDPDTAESARQLKDKFGADLCLYPIQVGDDAKGNALMKEIAEIGGCGFYTQGDSLLSSSGMENFVEEVFLTTGAGRADQQGQPAGTAAPAAAMAGTNLDDADNDGVIDSRDNCPDTPAVVAVDEYGCPYDTDGDGVYDYKDNCPDTPKGAKVNAMGCWILGNPLFDFDKYDIKSEAFYLLNQVAAILQKNPSLMVILQGHTDNIGTESYNMKLSMRRANAVKAYLVDKGILKRRFSLEGFGFSRPIATNETEWGRSQNRRVEILPIK